MHFVDSVIHDCLGCYLDVFITLLVDNVNLIETWKFPVESPIPDYFAYILSLTLSYVISYSNFRSFVAWGQ